MKRSARGLATTTFSLLTLASLAFGVSQALARPAAPSEARRCGDCNAYCVRMNGPGSVGTCTHLGCICTDPGN